MGITRKIMSASTLGAVDFRSDKERTASNTAASARAAKKQNKLIAEQNKLIAKGNAAPAAAQPVIAAAPASAPSLAQQLTDLGKLRSDGLLTDAEFDAAKARLLAG